MIVRCQIEYTARNENAAEAGSSVVSDRVNDRSDPLTGQRGQKGQSTLTRSNAKRGNKFGVVKDNEIYNITYKSCGWNSNVKNVKGRIA